MKKKNGFISMALVYSFLVIFLFIMSSIINVYLRKNAYLEALDNQVAEDIGITKESRATLISKILDSNVSHQTNNIDFTKVSALDNGNGVYYITAENKGDENFDGAFSRIYFFRGNVDNNVVYGKEGEQQVCWKIIRTNDNGTIRLIYNGKLDASNGCNGNTPYITEGVTTNKYNENTDDNAYVGYSYGEVRGTSYEVTHRKSESTKSTIRNTLEKWIDEKFEFNEATSKTADAIYCNDRRIYNIENTLPSTAPSLSISNQTGFSDNETVYKSYDMLSNNVSYVCSETMDRFALRTSFINIENNGEVLYNPYINAFSNNAIGLPTIADIVYAGGTYNQASNYFFNAGVDYWTMSPAFYSNSKAHMFIVSSNGAISTAPTNSDTVKIRPVISVSGDIKVNKGYGTIDEPYILE